MHWLHSLLVAHMFIALPAVSGRGGDVLATAPPTQIARAPGPTPKLHRRGRSRNRPAGDVPRGNAMDQELGSWQRQLATTPPEMRDENWRTAWRALSKAAKDPQEARRLWVQHNADRRSRGEETVDGSTGEQKRLQRVVAQEDVRHQPGYQEHLNKLTVAEVADEWRRVQREKAQREALHREEQEKEAKRQVKNQKKYAKKKEKARLEKGQQEGQGGVGVKPEVDEQAEKMGALKLEGPSKGKGESR